MKRKMAQESEPIEATSVTAETPIAQLLFSVAQELDAEQTTRNAIRACCSRIEVSVRRAQAAQQLVYVDIRKRGELFIKISCELDSIKSLFQELKQLFPKEHYFKYNEHWRSSLSDIVQLMAFAHWFTHNELITIGFVNQALDFYIESDDYLMGVCGLPSDLARFCVNAVTSKDYQYPPRIQKFVNELYSGFRLLNLKNDDINPMLSKGLRRRMDTIKYDVKKIEEVVYDVSIRGLLVQGAE